MKRSREGLNKFIKSYCRRRVTRLHVPGHQGRCGFLNRNLAAKFDITEVEGADWLFDSQGVLKNLEQKLSSIFGYGTAVSTCGSTLCVQTMVALCRKKTFIAHRNSAHVSFFNACALLNVDVHWFGFGDLNGLNYFDLNEVENILLNYSKCSCALYLTSPDYYGIVAPVEQILKLCKKYGALCLVDCAHGAHLNFVNFGSHPTSLGADLCCSSLHKTLPALTGAAFLNYNENLFSKSMVKSVMSMFSTTSPSYLIMASIDFCADWLQRKGVFSFSRFLKKKQDLIKNLKLPILETDVSKLVVDCRRINLSGVQLAQFLRSKKIEPEFANENFVVMVLSPFLSFTDWLRLERCLKKIKFEFTDFGFAEVSKYDFGEVCFSRSVLLPDFMDVHVEAINLNEEAVGRVVAKTKFKSPPGTVIVAAGERLNLEMILELKEQGQGKIEVQL